MLAISCVFGFAILWIVVVSRHNVVSHQRWRRRLTWVSWGMMLCGYGAWLWANHTIQGSACYAAITHAVGPVPQCHYPDHALAVFEWAFFVIAVGMVATTALCFGEGRFAPLSERRKREA